MTGKDILDLFTESGYVYTETSHYDDEHFQVVNDLGVGEGRASVSGEIVSDDDGKLEVNLSYYNEVTSFGDEWHKTIVATPDMVVAVVGNALNEGGQQPPKVLIKAA